MWASMFLSPYLHPKSSSLYSKLCQSPHQCGVRIGLYTLSSRQGLHMGYCITKGVSKQCIARLCLTVLFSLLIMSIVLILVIVIILVIGPTMTVSSCLLRTPAMASTSIESRLVSLEIGFAVAAVLITAALICASWKPIVLKLALIVLRSLASASLCEAFKLLATALTSKRSAASILT